MEIMISHYLILDRRCPNGCSCHYDDNDNLKVICKNGWDEETVSNIAKITKEL